MPKKSTVFLRRPTATPNGKIQEVDVVRIQDGSRQYCRGCFAEKIYTVKKECKKYSFRYGCHSFKDTKRQECVEKSVVMTYESIV